MAINSRTRNLISPETSVYLTVDICRSAERVQGRIEPPKAARGHATHIDGIVLNVTKFRIQILCSLHCVMGRSAHTIEVLRLSV